jgi:hypothetical protein
MSRGARSRPARFAATSISGDFRMRHFAFVRRRQQRRSRSAPARGGGSRPTLPPMLYRFFHYVAAKFLGLLPCFAPNMYDSAAVEAAAMFAPPLAAISDNPPSMSGDPYGGHKTQAQFWGYNYCGPGNNGGPTQPKTVDDCCKDHDNCYGKSGLSAGNVSIYPPGKGAGPAQRICDQALCNCLENNALPSGPYDLTVMGGAMYLFCYHQP